MFVGVSGEKLVVRFLPPLHPPLYPPPAVSTILILNRVKSKIPNISSVATTTVKLTNEVPNIGSLIKNSNFDAKLSDIEKKYLSISDYDKFMKKKHLIPI